METTDERIAGVPAELRPAVQRWFERACAEHGPVHVPNDLEATLLRVLACSEFAGSVLLREWPALRENPERLSAAPDRRTLADFCRDISASEAPLDEVKSQLRRFRDRYLLQVLWRELSGAASLVETLDALSVLADSLIAAAASYAERQLVGKHGRFVDADGEPVPFVILGMGKLGGGELNFSSDIDLVFLFRRDGQSDGPRSLIGQQYFTRLSQILIALLDEVTADGFVYRVDTRLRPFGDSGPPVISFGALESYLLRHGRDWERYAYVKARIVGPQPPAAVRAELFDDVILPFVYRRYLDYGIFESLRDMHAMIAAEVSRRELADNVKLGPGGIREIEFIVQSLQLVRGGNRSELRQPALLRVLPALADTRGLGAGPVRKLEHAYTFLRRLENFIQAIRDKQTHELPVDPADRARLCLAMGFDSWEDLAATLAAHRDAVSREFGAVAFRDDGVAAGDPALHAFAALWESGAEVSGWAAAFGDTVGAAELAKLVAAFRNASATLEIDTPARRRLKQFMPRLLRAILQTGHPVRALERALAVIDGILRRSAYIALLNENPIAADRLVSLCERSGYIASQIARYPVLLDELLDPRIYSERVDKADLEAALAGQVGSSGGDSETRMEALAQFQRATLFRIAVADFGGDLPIMKVSDSLTYLAETVIECALQVAWNDVTAKHGEPRYESEGDVHAAGFGVIAYGKLGGLELSYGSDLDLVFLHDSHGSGQMTDGEAPLENAVFFARLVRRLVHFLTTQTSSGVMYEIDMRLRPDGRSGLLVTGIDAFEKYQEGNAWTWEHQALLRARPVAGSPGVAREFRRVRADTLTARVRRDALRDDVVSMRARMRKELDRSDEHRFDLKHGPGGIGDIEFIVQYLVLGNAARYPGVIRYSDNIRQLAALASVGCIDVRTAARLQDAYRAFRRRLHHLSLNNEPAFAENHEFAEERDCVAAVWQQHLGARQS